MTGGGLTIAIITKDRADILVCLLDSLKKQVKLGQNNLVEVLIIDNSPQKTAFEFVKKYKNISYVWEKQEGAVYARERAMYMCKTKYLTFLDDDCNLSVNWLESVIKTVKKRYGGDVCFWQGVSKLGNPKSVWAKAQYRETKESYEEIKIDPSKLQFHLDTKNVILDLEKLKKKKIIFDTRFGFRKSCGYEDMDLGMQIHKLGMTGLLVPSVEVGHPEPTNVIRIFKKYFNRGAISVEGEIKWKYEQKFRNFSELFFNTRLVARDVLTPDNDKKFFWCCLFIDWFYYLGYKWEKLRRRFLVY